MCTFRRIRRSPGNVIGGAPLHAKPSPTSDQIAEAVVKNMLGRAAAAGMTLTDDEVAEVREWFGGARLSP